METLKSNHLTVAQEGYIKFMLTVYDCTGLIITRDMHTVYDLWRQSVSTQLDADIAPHLYVLLMYIAYFTLNDLNTLLLLMHI